MAESLRRAYVRPMHKQVLHVVHAAVAVACATGPTVKTSASSSGAASARVFKPALQDDRIVAQPNDNRIAAGSLRDGVLTIAIDARIAAWKPDATVDSAVTIQTFSERGKAPTVPGPLIRVPIGTKIRATLHNAIPDSTLIVHGLRAGGPTADTIVIKPGATREVSFTPAEPGTYLYWGSTSNSAMDERWGREAQLNGAIVVDPPGVTNGDRVFVLSLIDIYPDSLRNPLNEEIWEVAINGLSWPHTDRLNHKVGDTVRWRMINATDRVHPMHLHGFHFRTLAKGDWTRDTTYAPEAVAHAVTEFMTPGSTTRIEWTPTRAGNWLMHCHMTPHITPYPERPDSVRMHDSHDIMRHPEQSMAGLVLGIVVTDASPVAGRIEPKHRERIFAQQTLSDSANRIARGFVLQRGAEPQSDSVEVPGSPLVLYRGERTEVTVLNRLKQPTTVHWHGMELESVFDGVSGWSGIGGSRAPLVMPGDSFTVAFTPPRAGTYMYHTHMDEEDQVRTGMYAPMLVLEPGEVFNPTRDLIFTAGSAVLDGKREGRVLNGVKSPKPLNLVAGTRYRFRLINIHPVLPMRFSLVKDTVPLIWRAISKDGAALPAARSVENRASVVLGVGETYDFEWTPANAMEVRLQLGNARLNIAQHIIVRAPAVTRGAASGSAIRRP